MAQKSDITFLFNWEKKSGSTHYFLFFLFLSFFLHILCFYIFQVIPPIPEEVTSQPAHIYTLSLDKPNGNTETHPTLIKLYDKLTSLNPLFQTPLIDYETPFHPSFRNYTLNLQTLPEKTSLTPLPLTVNPGETILPPLSQKKNAENQQVFQAAIRSHPQYTLRGEIAQRKIRTKPEWGEEISKTTEGRRFSCFLGINHFGNIRYAFMDEGIDSSLEKKMMQKIYQIQFEPTSKNSLCWGWLDLQW